VCDVESDDDAAGTCFRDSRGRDGETRTEPTERDAVYAEIGDAETLAIMNTSTACAAVCAEPSRAAKYKATTFDTLFQSLMTRLPSYDEDTCFRQYARRRARSTL
jgi:hypothetical protein